MELQGVVYECIALWASSVLIVGSLHELRSTHSAAAQGAGRSVMVLEHATIEIFAQRRRADGCSSATSGDQPAASTETRLGGVSTSACVICARARASA